jgi:hypothetical protein
MYPSVSREISASMSKVGRTSVTFPMGLAAVAGAVPTVGALGLDEEYGIHGF